MFRDEDPERTAQDGASPVAKRAGVSRRDLLKNTAGAVLAAAGAGLVRNAAAQVTGSTPGGGTVPLRMPACALDYLDTNQYIRNMEIHAHIQPRAGGGEPWPMWARGAQRILTGNPMLDVTDPKKPVIIKVNAGGTLAYATRLKKWILIDASGPPITPPTPQYPRGKYHKEYADQSINWKGLRGFQTFDATDIMKPVQLGEFTTDPTGGGCTEPFYDGTRYAYFPCAFDDSFMVQETSERVWGYALLIADVWDPAKPKEVSRWWVPGSRKGEEAEYKKWMFANDQSSSTFLKNYPIVPKPVEEGGDIMYGGWGHFGLIIQDLTDITKPKVWAQLRHPLEGMGGIPWHTACPVLAEDTHPQLKGMMFAVPEALESDCREPWRTGYMVDIRDKTKPKIVGLFPRPMPDPKAPYPDFCCARGRFMFHNPQTWVAPGKAKPNLMITAYMNAGVRVFDISDPTEPKEVAYFVGTRAPGDINKWDTWRRSGCEFVFVEWDRNLIWAGTHEGVYCLSCPALGKPVLEPRRVERWSVPHINVGWDDQTPRSAYFGRGLSQMGY